MFSFFCFFFFFNDTATTEIYTLSLHDALPILARARSRSGQFAWQIKHVWTALGRSKRRPRMPAIAKELGIRARSMKPEKRFVACPPRARRARSSRRATPKPQRASHEKAETERTGRHRCVGGCLRHAGAGR